MTPWKTVEEVFKAVNPKPWRDSAVKRAQGSDMLVLPLEGNDIACFRYRVQFPDGRIMPVNLPFGHWNLWGKAA